MVSKEEQEDGEYCILRSFIFCTPRQISLGRPIKADEMGGACNRYGSEEKRICVSVLKL
jgi:hypothetical protein